MAQQRGIAVIYGMQPMKPIVNLPKFAKVRIRLRAKDVARAFVKYPDRIEHWIIVPANGLLNCQFWKLDVKQGENRRIK